MIIRFLIPSILRNLNSGRFPKICFQTGLAREEFLSTRVSRIFGTCMRIIIFYNNTAAAIASATRSPSIAADTMPPA